MNAFLVLLEKVLATFIQVFLTAWLGAETLGASTAEAAAIAGIAAALTVLANGIPEVPGGLPFVLDLVFRAVRTFAVAFLTFLTAAPVFRLDYSVLVAAAAAALPLALTVLKGGIARYVGDSTTPALLPAGVTELQLGGSLADVG